MMPDERLSMADQLGAAWDKMEKETPDAGQGSDSPREDTQGGEGAAEDQAAQRARDEAGRFAKADKGDGKAGSRETLTLKPRETTDAAPKPERQEGGTEPKAEAAKPLEAQAPAGPPQHWNGNAKIDWNKIPGALRESIAKDYEAIAPMREIAPVLQQYAPMLQQRYGGNVAQGITSVLQLYNNAVNDPLAFARDFCQQWRIDPQKLGGSPVQAQGQEQPADDPYGQRFQQIETALQQIAQQPVIHQQNQVQSDIQTFQTAALPDGSVEHPYFNDVRSRMAAAMQTPGGPATLKEAYDEACWAAPAIRAELIRETERKALDQRKQAVAKAQLAGGSITGSPGVARSEAHVSQSVRADLLKNWDAQEARV